MPSQVEIGADKPSLRTLRISGTEPSLLNPHLSSTHSAAPLQHQFTPDANADANALLAAGNACSLHSAAYCIWSSGQIPTPGPAGTITYSQLTLQSGGRLKYAPHADNRMAWHTYLAWHCVASHYPSTLTSTQAKAHVASPTLSLHRIAPRPTGLTN